MNVIVDSNIETFVLAALDSLRWAVKDEYVSRDTISSVLRVDAKAMLSEWSPEVSLSTVETMFMRQLQKDVSEMRSDRIWQLYHGHGNVFSADTKMLAQLYAHLWQQVHQKKRGKD